MFVLIRHYKSRVLRWRLGTLYVLACQVRVTLGDLGVCCLSEDVSPVAFRYPVFTRISGESDLRRFRCLLFIRGYIPSGI